MKEMLSSVTRLSFLFLIVSMTALTVYSVARDLKSQDQFIQAFLTTLGMSATFFFAKSKGGEATPPESLPEIDINK